MLTVAEGGNPLTHKVSSHLSVTNTDFYESTFKRV